MRYLIPVCAVRETISQVFKEYPMRSGFYNWAKVMEADVMAYNKVEDLEKYDVVHINMCPVDWWMALDAGRKLKNSSTKLVLNNDHVSEFWHKWELDPMVYQQIQEMGDVVFGTEPYQTSQMIDRAVTMPHPANIKEIKMFTNKFNDKDNDWIGMFYHHYNNTILQSVLLAKKLKEELNAKIGLYNYVKATNKADASSEYHFDEIYRQYEFPQFLMSLMKNKMMVELAEYHTYGRATVETAAIGVPTIGTDRVFSMRHNFPKLCTDPLDHRKIREIAKKVWTNDKFRQEQIDYAYESCEFFNYKNSKERMIKELDKVEK